MNVEKLLRELRLMKDQPTHRFYAVLGLVFVVVMRHPLASAAVLGLLSWHQFR